MRASCCDSRRDRVLGGGAQGVGTEARRQLGVIIEVMLGTSARIGEVLAIRRRDIDLSVPSVRIAGTFISPKGKPTSRQDHPRTARSRRTIQLPGFAGRAVQRRLRELKTIDPDALLYCSREGTPLTTNNVRRQLRHVMNLAGIVGVTPHAFRRTVATTVNEQAGVELASQLLGHTDPTITIKHYIRRNETVDHTAAECIRMMKLRT